MVIRKNIILTALLISLTAGASVAGTNDLLKMDVKKSGSTDTVDVTFYTTGGSTNSVVTRKSDNRYVVLLPNVAGSSSVTPNIGGVKDLITNIDVKNIDDGIGGYTKVTFTTSKPVKIQTAMKKTAPLTKAQEDYKNLIAQNKNTKPAVQQQKSTVQAKPASQPKTQTKDTTKQAPKVENKNTKTAAAAKPTTKATTAKTTPEVKVTPKPQTKPVNNTKTETKITNNIKPAVPVQTSAPKQEPKIIEQPAAKVVETATQPAAETPAIKTGFNDILKEYGINLKSILTIVLSSIAGLIALIAFSKLFSNKRTKANEPVIPVYKNRIKPSKYYGISNDENLNWQEKYNKYNEINEQNASPIKDLSYITNASTSQKAILKPKEKSSYKVDKIETNYEEPKLYTLPPLKPAEKTAEKKPPLTFKNLMKVASDKKKKEKLKEELRTRISQMEHSLENTPKLELPSEYKKDIYSEADSISDKLSEIRLKSFAHPSLSSTHRMLLGAERVNAENIKEGRFVKLKSSPLNVSRRKSASSEINSSDYYKNHGEMNMDKKDSYAVSSLNEYFSILDSEEHAKDYFTKPSPVVDGKVSNPISSTRKAPAIGSLSGMIVRSSYNIDSNRGFYIVDMDGASALIGKINDNVFILKKFNEIIDKKLQVRLDSGTVYMVRAGRYKCLVDVSKDRMGTLVEI